MMNICLREDFRYIEQLSNGDWLVRYGMVSAGHTPDGRELVSFGSSEYPEKPSLEQIRHSIYRYAMAHLHDEEILGDIASTGLAVYQGVQFFPAQHKTTIVFEKEDDYEDY